MAILSLTPLQKATMQLDQGLKYCNKNPNDELLRDGVIQRFEYTYELTWKMLKRYIELTAANPESIDEMSFPNLIRTGSEQGLLRSGWDKWKDYRKARGTTSHVYDELKAKEVFAVIPDFLAEANYLLDELSKRIAKT